MSMDSDEMNISAVLSAFVYLDDQHEEEKFEGKTLGEILSAMTEDGLTLEEIEAKIANNEDLTLKKGYCNELGCYKDIVAAIEKNPELANYRLVSRSTSDGFETGKLLACTFESTDGTYYVAYRGTGDGKWLDNGEGLYKPSTVMQEAAADYFDTVVARLNLNESSRVVVTGHSKGGNSAQYTALAAKYQNLIDVCYSFDGQGFSDAAITSFKEKYGDDGYQAILDKMYSINSVNDPVHELGYVVIPEEHTYYVNVEDVDGVGELHMLECMLIDGRIDTNFVEEGAIGNFAKTLSEKMMAMDEDEIQDCALSVMYLIEKYTDRGGLFYDSEQDAYVPTSDIGTGTVEAATIEDICGLISLGVPIILGAASTTLLPEVGALAIELVKESNLNALQLAGLTAVVLECAPAIMKAATIVTSAVAPLLIGAWGIATMIDSVDNLVQGNGDYSDSLRIVVSAIAIAATAGTTIAAVVLAVVAVVLLVDFVRDHLDDIHAFIEGVGDFVLGVVAAICAWVENLVSEGITFVINAINKAKELYQDIKDKITAFGEKLVSDAKDFFLKISQKVGSAFEKVGTWIKRTFGSGSSALKSGKQLKVTFSYISDLEASLRKVENRIDALDTCLENASRTVKSVNRYYNESYVRSCCSEIQRAIKKARQYASSLEMQLKKKRHVLALASEGWQVADLMAADDILRGTREFNRRFPTSYAVGNYGMPFFRTIDLNAADDI